LSERGLGPRNRGGLETVRSADSPPTHAPSLSLTNRPPRSSDSPGTPSGELR
jgi:hypothetical protein